MHPAGCWTGHSNPADALARPANHDKSMTYPPFCLGSTTLCILLGAGQVTVRCIPEENGAISQDSAWRGLIKKRLQPLLNLVYYSVHASTHSLPDESVDNNDNCDENNKNKNRTRRVH